MRTPAQEDRFEILEKWLKKFIAPGGNPFMNELADQLRAGQQSGAATDPKKQRPDLFK